MQQVDAQHKNKTSFDCNYFNNDDDLSHYFIR